MLLVVAGPAALAQAPPASSPAVASSAAEWVVFVSSRSGDGDLYAVRPDGTGLRMVLGTEAAEGTVRYDPARTRLVYHRFSDSGAMLMSGSRALFEDPNGDVAPAWSTRGEVVYVAERDGRADLFVADSLGGSVRRLTSDPEVERYPAWSPDGSRIAFDTFRGGQTEIVVLDLEGMDVTDLTRRPGNDLVPNWSADGGRIVFGAEVEPGNWDVWIVDTTTLALTRLTSDPAADGGPVFVPEAALPPGGP
jgi:Tol biopolymer transport system component